MDPTGYAKKLKTKAKPTHKPNPQLTVEVNVVVLYLKIPM